MTHWEMIEMINPGKHEQDNPKLTVYARHWFFKIPPMQWGIFRQFIAITIFKYILFRGAIKARIVRHELVHVEQQGRECCALMFYVKYGLEFIYNVLFKYPFKFTKAYHNISYEIEAYKRTH
jgi:hypothetical protein